MTLYEQVSGAIENYNQTAGYFDMEEFWDGITDSVLKLYPDSDVLIYDYDTGNDTYELDRQLDDIMEVMKDRDVIDYCNVWDELTIITVIVAKKRG